MSIYQYYLLLFNDIHGFFTFLFLGFGLLFFIMFFFNAYREDNFDKENLEDIYYIIAVIFCFLALILFIMQIYESLGIIAIILILLIIIFMIYIIKFHLEVKKKNPRMSL